MQYNRNNQLKEQKIVYKKIWKRKEIGISYTQALKGERKKRGSEEVWNGMHINVVEEDKEWLKRSYIGSLNSPQRVENLQESFLLQGLSCLKLRYLGDDKMLISSDEELDIQMVIEEHKEWLSKIFERIYKWENHMRPRKRRVWVRCWGIPISLWGKDCFQKVAGREINIGGLRTGRC